MNIFGTGVVKCKRKNKEIGIIWSDSKKRIINFTVTYIFVLLIFGREVFSIEVKESINRIDYFLGYLCLYIFPLYYYLVIQTCEKVKANHFQTNKYYATQFPDINNLKRVKYLGVDAIIGHLLNAIFYMFLAVILLSIIVNNNERIKAFFSSVHENIWREEEYSAIISLLLAVYALVFALVPIINTYVNRKCMFFDSQELPVIRYSNYTTGISLGVVFIYFLSKIVISESFWFGFLEFLWIALIVTNILMYICMWYMPVHTEHKVLNRIDQLYCKKKIYMTPNKRWYKGNVIRQINYLVNNYKKSVKKIEFDNIENIEFACILASKEENMKLAIKKFYSFFLITVCFIFIYMCYIIPLLSEEIRWAYLMITMLGFMPVFTLFLDRKIITNNYKYINRIGYMSYWGYYIKLFNKKDKIYITSFDHSCSQYAKYLIKLKKIACFYNLAIHMKYDDVESFDDIGIECLCNYVTDMLRRKTNIDGMVTPILICTCLSWDEKKEIRNQRVKEMIKEVDMSKGEQQIAINTSLQILRDIHGNDDAFFVMGYQKILLDLFE